MNQNLEKLLEAARKISMSEGQKEEQRRSFAYGNTRIENKDITRETINQEAERLKKTNG